MVRKQTSQEEAGGVRRRLSFNQPVEAFRQPYFRLYWFNNLLQWFSMTMQLVARQWLVTGLTPSRTLLGFVGFVQGGIGMLVSPLAGVATDRFSKRNLLIVTRFFFGILALSMALLVWTDQIRVWQVVTASMVAGLLMAFMAPASQTYIYDIVGRGRTQSAVALNSAATGMAQMTGPALGGVLIAVVGVMGAYLTSGASYFLGIIFLAMIPILGVSTKREGSSTLRDLREGFAYVMTHKPVMWAMVACSMAIFNGSIFAMRPIFARHVLDVGSIGFGVMSAVMGTGAVLAAIIVSSLPRLPRPGIFIAGSMLGYATCIFLYSFAFSYAYILVVEFALGAVGQMWQVSTMAGLQLAVPEYIRGRIISMVFLVIQTAFMGQLFVGMLADATNDQFALGVFGLIPMVVLVSVLLFAHRSLREL